MGNLFEADVGEMFDLDESSEITVIRANVHDVIMSSTKSSPITEQEILRREAPASSGSTYEPTQLTSSQSLSSPTTSQQQLHQRRHDQSMDTGMSPPVDSFDMFQQQQKLHHGRQYTPPPVNPPQQKEKTGTFLSMFNKLTSSSRQSLQGSYSPDKPSVPSGILRSHSLPSTKPTVLLDPEDDSVTTATDTTMQSSRSIPTQKEKPNNGVDYSREVVGGRKIKAMSEYEVDLNEL